MAKKLVYDSFLKCLQHNIESNVAFRMVNSAEDVDLGVVTTGPQVSLVKEDEVGNHFLASAMSAAAPAPASSPAAKHQCPVCKNEVMASFMERHLSVMHVLSKQEKSNMLLGMGIQPSAPSASSGKPESTIKKAQCPKCNNLVVTKYMERHLQIIHKMDKEEMKSILDDLGISERT